jgi:uncharacterized membrane protein
MEWLVLGAIGFVGSHFAMSHSLRGGMVRALGEQGFMGVYSLVSFVTMGAMIWGFRMVGPGGVPLWDGTGSAVWAVASGLSLVGMVLLVGSLHGNPAMPQVSGEAVAAARATGVFAVTRHPMMWGIALWAIAHVLVSPSARVLVLDGAMLVLALVGARLQDGKKARVLGQAWAGWSAQTSYWPRFAGLLSVRPVTWGIGAGVWLGATYGHIHANHVLAGVWRWVI